MGLLRSRLRAALLAGLALGAALVAGCGSSASTCSGAVSHYYAAGCSVSNAGVPLDAGVAVAQCQETADDFAMPSESTECPCASQFQAQLACMATAAADAGCTDCSTPLMDYANCLAENPGCAT